MLFNSYIFIFLFLPVVLLGFFRFSRISHKVAAGWLAAASLFFYGYWNPTYVILLLASIGINYRFGQWIAAKPGQRKPLTIAISANLALLAYYKYSNFFVTSLVAISGVDWSWPNIILPLGISFFTFTQIAYLVDTWRGQVREHSFVHYLLFVTYFPHLIAGPVLHHKEMMPQFARPSTYVVNAENIAVGLSVFILGLAKKLILADSLAEFANPIFSEVNQGGQPMLFEAWLGALTYTLQLYFDFSGYSDMAVGLSLMFNIRLPMNFNSPYKARNIIDFWRRWHITLSHFLRDYLYIPLGGNRKGPLLRHWNLFLTMLLGGLWHGAGWTFVMWGGLHGTYLIINHLWRALKKRLNWSDAGFVGNFCAGVLTFLAVVVAWVFFRADSFHAAYSMLRGMIGMNGITVSSTFASQLGAWGNDLAIGGMTPLSRVNFDRGLIFVLLGLLIVWGFPNVLEIFSHYQPSTANMPSRKTRFSWKPSPVHAWIIGLLFVASISLLTRVSDFLYFQF